MSGQVQSQNHNLEINQLKQEIRKCITEDEKYVRQYNKDIYACFAPARYIKADREKKIAELVDIERLRVENTEKIISNLKKITQLFEDSPSIISKK